MTRTCPNAPLIGGAISVELEIVPVSAPLIRFHSTSRSGFTFNPNIAADGQPSRMEIPEEGARFSPFPGRPRTNVPTLYAGSTAHAAARESVFHDVPHEPDPTYSSGKLRDFAMSTTTLHRAIKVLRLVNNQLKQFAVPGRPTSLMEDELIHTLPEQYPATRSWANYFHQSLPDIAGLAWHPRLGSEGTAYVFFGDRMTVADFGSPTAPVRLNAGEGRKLIEQIAKDSYIQIIDTH
jgi:RES domain